MSLKNPSTSFQNVNEYLASGIPHVTTFGPGTSHIEYQSITKSIVISSLVSSSYVSFSNAASNLRTFVVPQGQIATLPLRVKEIWASTSGSMSICAALTVIPSGTMPSLTDWMGI